MMSKAAFTAHLKECRNAAGRIGEDALLGLAAAAGFSLLEAQQRACAAGVLPERYARNTKLLGVKQQRQLLQARVLVVGLGGLGGHVLDMLARMGVGRITGADGDVFEESNCNRQLLATRETLGQPKVTAAARHVARVNPAVEFSGLEVFLRGAALDEAVMGVDLVVDALGGLRDRADLERAASQAEKPLVSAGIAGLTGWCMVIRPGERGPAHLLGAAEEGGVEETLGNPSPTVAMAAALQCAEVMKLLAGLPVEQGLLVFDLADMSLERVRL